jgi:hypothetical protein
MPTKKMRPLLDQGTVRRDTWACCGLYAPRRFQAGRFRASRTGFTLLEVLIATVATMLMMLSLAVIFKSIGDSMKHGRAALELNNRLRNVVTRIRQDLDNMTVNPARAVNDATPQNGYMQYYEGSLTDYSTTLSAASGGISASKFGDVDDILMFTARAGDEWFSGKVPLYVLRKAAAPTSVADTAMVTIASQHAEIVVFCEPQVTNVNNPNRDTAMLVSDPMANYADQDSNGYPDGFRLHYRALLIRPDLNIPFSVGGLSGFALGQGIVNVSSVNEHWLMAESQALTNGTALPMCDMARAHAQCDLSLKRVGSYVAANSLDDLVNPVNRFAHFRVPLASGITSMPLLALGRSLPIITTDPNGYLGAAVSTPGNLVVGSGFMHPAFTLHTGWDDTSSKTTANRVGEDVLTTDLLAFDIKAFDPFAAIVASYGPDDVPGSAGDDDANSATDDASELGFGGSDDVIVTPNDPGFALALKNAYPASGATTAMVIGAGEYVDLGWARKVIDTFGSYGLAQSSYSSSLPSNTWASQLSGYNNTFWTAGGAPFTSSLYKSGQIRQVVGNAIPDYMQISYDTYTSVYEGDGDLQSHFPIPVPFTATPSWPGTVWFTTAPGGTVPDKGTDGLDNDGAKGADDIDEKETSAPFPVDLRGLRIGVRIEDPASREFAQQTITKEFVNQ